MPMAPPGRDLRPRQPSPPSPRVRAIPAAAAAISSTGTCAGEAPVIPLAASVPFRCAFWKHCRQSTGRPCVGLNGTVVSTSHVEQIVRVSVREIPAAAGPDPAATITPERRPLHGLHRFGSFLNCLSKKKSCSPAVNTNCPPQSAHSKMRSAKSMEVPPIGRRNQGPNTETEEKGTGFVPAGHSATLREGTLTLAGEGGRGISSSVGSRPGGHQPGRPYIDRSGT